VLRDTAIHKLLKARRSELGQLGAQLAAMSPLAVLDRGYAVVHRGDAVVRAADEVSAGDRLRVRLARGELTVTVDVPKLGDES